MFVELVSLITFDCSEAPPYEIVCNPIDGNYNCTLDEEITTNCIVNNNFSCEGSRYFQKKVPCRFCYQLPESQYKCEKTQNCEHSFYPVPTRCYAQKPCIDNSMFYKMKACRAARKSHKVALFLSLLTGIFGIDRFYLGYNITGVFKLISFGGLGLLYLVDVTLIFFGVLGPSDGSFYVERFE